MYIKLEQGQMSDLQGKNVLLFGAGSLGVRSIEEFHKIGAHIVGFVDNNRQRKGEKVSGYTIYAPEDIGSFPNAYVIITSTYVEEIKQQLTDMGVAHFDVIRLGALRDALKQEDFFKPFLSREEANRYLYEQLCAKKPFFAGRLGSNELECMVEYKYLLKRINGGKDSYHDNLKLVMKQGAGFYPTEDRYLDRFSELYIKNMQQIDFMWSMWLSRFENLLYEEYIPDRALALYDETAFPYDMEHPWTEALRGKKVLVIHPFEESIRENYKKREQFFENRGFLPEFELKTLKAIQSIGDEQPEYPTWFEALEIMKRQINEIDFDIALMGAGAYGFPLGAYIKELGKKAIHIGGMLQLFFGIKGKAWNKLGVYNENWTSPKESERPAGYQKVEAGRYW